MKTAIFSFLLIATRTVYADWTSGTQARVDCAAVTNAFYDGDGGFNATYDDPDTVTRPAALWDQTVTQTSGSGNRGDYSGFIDGPNIFRLTVAVPTLYEGSRSTIKFETAADLDRHCLVAEAQGAGACVGTKPMSSDTTAMGSYASAHQIGNERSCCTPSGDTPPTHFDCDMYAPYDDLFNGTGLRSPAWDKALQDQWVVLTDQAWTHAPPKTTGVTVTVPQQDANAEANEDPASSGTTLYSMVNDGDCYTVYQLNTTWGYFSDTLGRGAAASVSNKTNAGLTRRTYDTYDRFNSTDGAPFDAAGKYIEFCGEMEVTMWQEFRDVGPFNLDIDRKVVDRFVFCLVFQTQVEVSTNITIFGAPDYFQLLQLQEVAELDPDNANCAARMDLNLVTLTQWPYQLKDFVIPPAKLDPTCSGCTGGENPGNSWYLKDTTTAGIGSNGPYYSLNGQAALCDVNGIDHCPNEAGTESASGEWGQGSGLCPDVNSTSLGSAKDANTNCQQDWAMQFCNTGCEADGFFVVEFNVKCRPSVKAIDCPLSGTESFNGTLTLNTASYCAILIEAVNVQGTMDAYSDGTLVTTKDNFLTGNTAYFKASFSAFVEDGSGSPPDICGVSPLSVSVTSIAGTTTNYASTLWTGDLASVAVGPTGYYQNGASTTATAGTTTTPSGYSTSIGDGEDLDFHMYLNYDNDGATAATAIPAIETTALSAPAAQPLDPSGNAAADRTNYAPLTGTAPTTAWETNLVGFSYTLGTELAPPAHGSFILQTTLLVNVVFCDTQLLGMAPDTRLLEIAFNDRYETYTDEELLQLQDGPQNMAEVGATVGMFDPFPEVEESPEEVVELPAKPQEEEIGKPQNNAVPVTGTESTTAIWPVIAGVVGGVTICIIVLLIGLRRRNQGKKTKTVAVVPNSQEYGKVAVAATEDSGVDTSIEDTI